MAEARCVLRTLRVGAGDQRQAAAVITEALVDVWPCHMRTQPGAQWRKKTSNKRNDTNEKQAQTSRTYAAALAVVFVALGT